MNKFLLFLLLVSAAKINAQVTINTVPDQCVGNPSFQLVGNPAGGVWSGNGVDVNGVFTPSVAGVGVTTVKYTFNSVSDSVYVAVNPIPVVSLTLQSNEVCANDPAFVLSGASPVGGVYSGIGVSSQAFFPENTGPGNWDITYLFTDANGCSGEAVANILVNAVPVLELGPDIYACHDELRTLDAGVFSQIKWYNDFNEVGTSRYLNVKVDKNWGTMIKVVAYNSLACVAADSVYINGYPCDTIFKIKGTVYNDLNQNGAQDSGELGLKNVPIYAQTANYYSMTTTDAVGNYSVNSFETGTATINIQMPYNSQLISPSAPAYHSVVISAMNDSVVGKNFAVHFLPDIHDVKVNLSSNLARPGFQTICNAYVYNKGTVTEKNISLDLAYDNLLTPSASSIPYSNANSILTFAIDSIKAGESKLVSVSFNVPQGANHLGHQLDYFGDVSLTTNDVYLSDNKDTCLRIITGSYDPNMKESKLGEGNISPNTKEMEYTIHFQNTGTDTAFTVVVKDSLNKAVFDYKEVEMLCASHNYTYTIDTAGVIAFTFNNILLVDSTTNEPASHGFVKFKVKLNNGLSIGTVLKNKAYIYFDFNAPIITNEATNTLSNSVGVNEVSNLNFTVYPNPSNDKITLMGSSASLYSVELYDVLGKRVYAQSSLQHAHVVNVSSLEKGIYFVSILQDGKQQVEKVVVQ